MVVIQNKYILTIFDAETSVPILDFDVSFSFVWKERKDLKVFLGGRGFIWKSESLCPAGD